MNQEYNIKKILKSLKEVNKKNKLSEVKINANNEEAISFFKFASDNSGVEWSLTKFQDKKSLKYSISTFHDEDFSPGLKPLGISDLLTITRWHSHPDILLSNERSSMGDTRDGSGGNSDWSKSIRLYNKYGREIYPMNVYFPDSGNIYKISPFKISKMGNSKK